jgi:hypothetical protein
MTQQLTKIIISNSPSTEIIWADQMLETNKVLNKNFKPVVIQLTEIKWIVPIIVLEKTFKKMAVILLLIKTR